MRSLARFSVLIVVLTGCGPRVEPGPVPWTGPNKGPVRLRERTGWAGGPTYTTLWDEGNGPVKASERVAALRDAVPDSLFQRLKTTRSVPIPVRVNYESVKPPDGQERGMFDQQVYKALATVVSLTPDIMIVTVRELPEGSYERPFKEWSEHTREGKIRLIATCGTELSVYADSRLPVSPEMYVVSTDADVTNGPLKFDGDRAVVKFSTGQLILRRNDRHAEVVRE